MGISYQGLVTGLESDCRCFFGRSISNLRPSNADTALLIRPSNQAATEVM
jgi:hypothetical protein